MIIEHVPIGDGKENTDTDKLPDIQALILEKAEELRLLCTNSSRQCVIIVDAVGYNDKGKATHFWNLKTNDKDDFTDPIIYAKAFANLFTMINIFVSTMSNGSYGVGQIVPNPEETP